MPTTTFTCKRCGSEYARDATSSRCYCHTCFPAVQAELAVRIAIDEAKVARLSAAIGPCSKAAAARLAAFDNSPARQARLYAHWDKCRMRGGSI